jgi:hypothetical protein
MARFDWDKQNRKLKLQKWLMDNSLRNPFWITSPYDDPDQVGTWARREIQLSLSRARHELSINHDFSESSDSILIELIRQVENSLDAGTTEALFATATSAIACHNKIEYKNINQKILIDLESVFDLLLTMTQDEERKIW